MQFLVLLSLTLSLIISILPFRIFIGCQMRLFSLLYYRLSKKVVRANLALALPHLKERVVIEKKIIPPFMTCLWK
jgi:lauroyl/myristoyl acyltransferase